MQSSYYNALNFTDYDRESYERDYYDNLTNKKVTCQGCIDFKKGQGGENQFAHMHPGGCLYDLSESESELESESNSDNDINIMETKKINVNSLSIDNNSIDKNENVKLCLKCKNMIEHTFSLTNCICQNCEKKEEQSRLIRYQTFTVHNYAFNM